MEKARTEKKAAELKQEAARKEGERQKERVRLNDVNTCFDCKKQSKDLTSCVCFEQEGISGHGVLKSREMRLWKPNL